MNTDCFMHQASCKWLVCYCCCSTQQYTDLLILTRKGGGACGVMVIVVGNGHGDTSTNPGRE